MAYKLHILIWWEDEETSLVLLGMQYRPFKNLFSRYILEFFLNYIHQKEYFNSISLISKISILETSLRLKLSFDTHP